MMKREPVRALRCAIYTRVSTEHGLEQEFNSLDSQREASEAYIKSQAHEGWRCLPARYERADPGQDCCIEEEGHLDGWRGAARLPGREPGPAHRRGPCNPDQALVYQLSRARLRERPQVSARCRWPECARARRWSGSALRRQAVQPGPPLQDPVQPDLHRAALAQGEDLR